MMTTCFTNKYTNGKLHRYYYYRCTSTMKHDWQACSVKQVSAERIEKSLVENLERIARDTSYLENLVFRMNHDATIPHEAGYELEGSCFKFSSTDIANSLNFFTNNLNTVKGASRNLLAKQCIQKVVYSPKTLAITLFFRPLDIGTPIQKQQTPLEAGSCEKIFDNQFATCDLAREVGIEPTTITLTACRSTAELLPNIGH